MEIYSMVHKRVLVLYYLNPQLYHNLNAMQQPKENLTRKELDTWELLAKGLMYKEIAASQGVTIDTIKKHSKNIYRKLQVRNRTEAVSILILQNNVVRHI